ncbi:MAG: sulfatase [Candidatus Nanohaloarchaea archaeon]|nr:sulfatase [Candidatus Nanohaloarchaea archaeon]
MPDRPPVVFIVLDTVRQDRVSCYGYDRETTPNLDAFAEDATQYMDAVAQAPWSVPSHASLLTGKYPSEVDTHMIRPALLTNDTLASWMSDAGYSTVGISSNNYVQPFNGFHRGFDTFHSPQIGLPDAVTDVVNRAVNGISYSYLLRALSERFFTFYRQIKPKTPLEQPLEDGSTWAVEQSREVIRENGEDLFLFLNMIDVHLPRSPMERFEKEFLDDELEDVWIPSNERVYNLGKVDLSDRQMQKMSQLYDADLRSVDERFGMIMEALKDEGIYDEALIVVASDHGENIGESDQIGHQFSLFDSVVSVPLLIKFPGQETHREYGEQVELRQVFHTILDHTGIGNYPEMSLEYEGNGRTAYGEYFTPMMELSKIIEYREPNLSRSMKGEEMTFVRKDGYKLIRTPEKEYFYQLPEKQGEELSLEGERLDRLSSLLDEFGDR